MILAVIATAVIAWSVSLRPGAGRSDRGSAHPAARQLTVDEAEGLALVRFQLYRAGGITASMQLPSPDGPIRVRAVMDYRQGFGTAAVTIGSVPGVVQWSAESIALWQGSDVGGEPPLTAPAATATVRRLDPSASGLDTVLAIVAHLASDRPENAQLLRQSTARWIRSDTVQGTRVAVIAGPSEAGRAGGGSGGIRYWIDSRGTLRRLELELPAGEVVVDVKAGAPTGMTRSPQLP